MKKRLHGLPSIMAAIGLVAGGAASAAPTDTVAPAAHMISAVYNPADPVGLIKAQWLFGGRNYCWYPGGWHGPGYYWCGYAYRRGFGWGGPEGWHGWRGDRGLHRGWDHRGNGWRGGRRGWNDQRGYRDQRDHRGDNRGDNRGGDNHPR
jgi:hypothetical protein